MKWGRQEIAASNGNHDGLLRNKKGGGQLFDEQINNLKAIISRHTIRGENQGPPCIPVRPPAVPGNWHCSTQWHHRAGNAG